MFVCACFVQATLLKNHTCNFVGSDLLGGLLSAYALSNDPLFLTKADEVADVMSGLFQHADRMPRMNPAEPGLITLGDGFMLELTYVSRITGKTVHKQPVADILAYLDALQNRTADFARHRLNVSTLLWQGDGETE